MSTEQFQSQIAQLKIRVFDTAEALSQANANVEQLSGVLSRIASIVGLESGPDGQVQLQDIIDAVVALVPEQEPETVVE